MFSLRLGIAVIAAAAVLQPVVLARAQGSPSIDWAAVLSAETDPRISVRGECLGDVRNPEYTLCVDIVGGTEEPRSGYAMTDLVTYGDLAGDGQTDAVVPLDSGGTVGISGFLVYRVSGVTPQLLDLQGGYGRPVIDQATSTLDVLVKLDGPNCCPTSMGRLSYGLVGDRLVEQGECEYVPSQQDISVPDAGGCHAE